MGMSELKLSFLAREVATLDRDSNNFDYRGNCQRFAHFLELGGSHNTLQHFQQIPTANVTTLQSSANLLSMKVSAATACAVSTAASVPCSKTGSLCSRLCCAASRF